MGERVDRARTGRARFERTACDHSSRVCEPKGREMDAAAPKVKAMKALESAPTLAHLAFAEDACAR